MKSCRATSMLAALLLAGCDRSFNNTPDPTDEVPEPRELAPDAGGANVLPEHLILDTSHTWSPELQLSDRDGETLLRTQDLPAVTKDGKALVALRAGGKSVERFLGMQANSLDLVVYAVPTLKVTRVFSLRNPKSTAAELAASVDKANVALKVSTWRALVPSEDGHHPSAMRSVNMEVDDLTLRTQDIGGLTLLKLSTRDGRAALERDISAWLGKKSPKGCTPVFANVAASPEMGAMYLETDWLGEKPTTRCPGRTPRYLVWVPIAM